MNKGRKFALQTDTLFFGKSRNPVSFDIETSGFPANSPGAPPGTVSGSPRSDYPRIPQPDNSQVRQSTFPIVPPILHLHVSQVGHMPRSSILQHQGELVCILQVTMYRSKCPLLVVYWGQRGVAYSHFGKIGDLSRRLGSNSDTIKSPWDIR